MHSASSWVSTVEPLLEMGKHHSQACNFGGYYVIYVNYFKIEVIYVIFLRLLCYFLEKWG